MWFASAKPPYGTLDAAERAPSTASKADMCSAKRACPLSPKSGHQRRLFDHLVGAGEQRRRHGEAERLGGLEIDHQLELGRRLHRQVGWLLAL